MTSFGDKQNSRNIFILNTQIPGADSEGAVIVIFFSLPPSLLCNRKARQGLMLDGCRVVTSVLAPGSGIQSGNGAKQIDVIARYLSGTSPENTNLTNTTSLFRIVFPAMFGVLNIIYWSYYLTRANMVTEHAK